MCRHTKAGVHRFTRNLGAAAKFKVPQHEANSLWRIHKYEVPAFKIQLSR
jgi:hypothetical protein